MRVRFTSSLYWVGAYHQAVEPTLSAPTLELLAWMGVVVAASVAAALVIGVLFGS